MKYILLSIFSLAFFANCLTAPIPGILLTSTNQHVTADATGNALTSAKIEKSGKSCSFSFFIANYLFYGAGHSVDQAVKDAGIKKIALIDRESLSILTGLFYRECVVVWGE
ncbi:TRL-like family protein [Leptospira bandrabouensis]|uniref:TRL domain-containing protein n=1 Tax=Leptospira bandrabouensis TaxID=2484903 RepID=UPI00223CC691|nr:TRL domain-containing protein [Leptospira bandrabouensis]MCW7460265.1 TRL-like family protein [Leptospira bandrabouensis]MCW7476632.1 TRL-like family protein [Leptospira bandrabouensis]MCW7484314.1 TRL-like family protein [Leptospira bandrabouensis]